MFNKKIKLIIRSSETGQKIDTVKFSKEESKKIRETAKYLNLSQDQLMNYAFDRFLENLKSGKPVW
jgi:hypothetical protein